jgi:hypothetical protein
MKSLPIILGVLAIGTAIPAWIPMPENQVVEVDLVGQVLNRTGKEVSAEQVVSVRVVTWDDSAGKPKVLEVRRNQGSWIIPSHYNYPADGGTRVGKTSGGVRNVARGRLVTRDSKLHEELGVVDPFLEDDKVKGRGKRVVLKDATEGVLVDLIIGKSAPDGDNRVFVRDAEDSAVYTARLGAFKIDEEDQTDTSYDVSSRFVDWVETDLLKLKSEDVRAISVSDYSVNEQTAAIEERSLSRFIRPAGATDWTSPQTPEGKRVLKDTLDKLLSQATSLRLSGVRRFDLAWLGHAGFFPSNNQQPLNRPDSLRVSFEGTTYALFGNEGRVDFTTKDGLRYSLLFGEISGEDEDKPSGDAAQAKKQEAGHNRYMSVYVAYDPAADEDAIKAKAEADAKKAEADKAAAADPTKVAEKPAEVPPTVAPGQARAAIAQARFSQFFYVISDENFKALRPALDKLFEAKPADPAPAPGAAAPAPGAAPILPPPAAPLPAPVDAPAPPTPAAATPPAPATPPPSAPPAP